MTHGDSTLVPSSITTKAEFWVHVHDQLKVLLEDRDWVTNLSNAAAQIYHSLLEFPSHFGRDDDKAVNWVGFYLDSPYFPTPRISPRIADTGAASSRLLLGPFSGKPACQFISTVPGKARGVCADSFLSREALLVPDVDAYPGHIACFGETKSEIVCPLILRADGNEVVVGVLDLDCLALGGFTEEDKVGLVKIADLIVNACDW